MLFGKVDGVDVILVDNRHLVDFRAEFVADKAKELKVFCLFVLGVFRPLFIAVKGDMVSEFGHIIDERFVCGKKVVDGSKIGFEFVVIFNTNGENVVGFSTEIELGKGGEVFEFENVGILELEMMELGFYRRIPRFIVEEDKP